MSVAEWLQTLEWLSIILVALAALCIAFFFAYLWRAPRWFARRSDRSDLKHALEEIVDHHGGGQQPVLPPRAGMRNARAILKREDDFPEV